MTARLWGIVTDSFWKILAPGLVVTLPLTALSFALAMVIAVAVALENGARGASLGSMAQAVLEYYFEFQQSTQRIESELTLLP